jgi:hypothetical protein
MGGHGTMGSGWGTMEWDMEREKSREKVEESSDAHTIDQPIKCKSRIC